MPYNARFLYQQPKTEINNYLIVNWFSLPLQTVEKHLVSLFETKCFNIKEQFVLLDETECSMPRNTLFSSTKQKSRNKIFSVTAFLILCLSKRLLFYLLQFQGFSCLKKSLPLSSTKMNAGKFSTSIFQIASIPSSGYSTHSMLLMLFCAKIAAGPPIEPK